MLSFHLNYFIGSILDVILLIKSLPCPRFYPFYYSFQSFLLKKAFKGVNPVFLSSLLSIGILSSSIRFNTSSFHSSPHAHLKCLCGEEWNEKVSLLFLLSIAQLHTKNFVSLFFGCPTHICKFIQTIC